MIGKLIGAVAGYQAAQYSRQINGPGGAALGAVTPMVLRRFGVVGVMGLAAGTFLITNALERRRMERVFGNMPVALIF